MTAARWAALAALLFALYFGIQGGEYGTTDLLALRRQEAAEEAQVLRLRQVVDSLTRDATGIERAARSSSSFSPTGCRTSTAPRRCSRKSRRCSALAW